MPYERLHLERDRYIFCRFVGARHSDMPNGELEGFSEMGCGMAMRDESFQTPLHFIDAASGRITSCPSRVTCT